jgi:hypothetical protein
MVKKKGVVMVKTIYSRHVTVQRRKDPFRAEAKLPESSQCKLCGAFFMHGKWVFLEFNNLPALHKTTCSACRRKEGQVPAGWITITGEFYSRHRNEIDNRILNIEKAENGRHPMERILTKTDHEGTLSVATTGIHLARRIGEGLHRSFKGGLAFSYGPGEEKVRVSWQR